MKKCLARRPDGVSINNAGMTEWARGWSLFVPRVGVSAECERDSVPDCCAWTNHPPEWRRDRGEYRVETGRVRVSQQVAGSRSRRVECGFFGGGAGGFRCEQKEMEEYVTSRSGAMPAVFS
jgi:hypothetical protein